MSWLCRAIFLKKNNLHFQVPSDGSTGVTNSTASSEVSRPVSLTSLGSCSSSGSSNGHLHQPGSAYLASAESLDSDPEPAGSQGMSLNKIFNKHSAQTPSMFFLNIIGLAYSENLHICYSTHCNGHTNIL